MKFISTSASLSVVAFAVLTGTVVLAHTEAGKPAHGGVIAKAEPLEVELVATTTKLTLYVMDHGKAVDTKGATAKLILLAGVEKVEATLAPAGVNRLEISGNFKLAKGTRVVGVVSVAGQKALSMRWVLPQSPR